ncbi:hypothetical protein ACWGDS_33165 [Streptomyces sp. NPDC055059]|uniref:Uncharacterized protein n=1 Tax=Streptomyces sp. NBC_00119 TaxID=2975659 RepID=A0AAU1UAV7_9ACTN|nr:MULTISPECIES: hypothetical protein [unclassified Streptomyces]MCX4644918.1 hypothetical protein [Streptomyces sp. NBC_01446]MCX5326427.1 hypothetical protein [Streptomyces sp. NBC_00120]
MTTDTTSARDRRRRRRRIGRGQVLVPLGAIALVGLHSALATRGHLLPPPAGGGWQGRVARPREVAAVLSRAGAGPRSRAARRRAARRP